MFYRTLLKDHIRVPPKSFGATIEAGVLEQVKKKFRGYIDKDIGIVIDVAKIRDIGDGIIIPGDGASYYETQFELLTFKPELQEVVLGKIKDIADFGAFMALGPIEGMIHISQTMDDFVSFAKERTLSGKESKKTLRVNDKCRARIIAVSFKDITNPKLGLTMRQAGLGRLDWLGEDEEKKENQKEKQKEEKPKAKGKKK